jgi:hypothetical protein
MTDATTTPTDEFVRQAGDRYVPPRVDQNVKRPYARIEQWWERMARPRGGGKPTLSEAEAKAARDFDLIYWTLMSPSKVIGAYGDQKWNGTPVSQLDIAALNSAEHRCLARSRYAECHRVIADEDEWHAINLAAEFNGTAKDVGRLLGARSERSCEMKGVRVLRSAFGKLAIHWGYIRTRDRYP